MKILKYEKIPMRKGESEPHVYFQMPAKYNLTKEDIVKFNQECIKLKELAICAENGQDIYIHVFDLPKKRIVKKKFIEESEKMVEIILRRWNRLSDNNG